MVSKRSATVAGAQVEPELLLFTVRNLEGLQKLIPLMASAHNEHWATKTWPGSRPTMVPSAMTFPFFFLYIFGGRLPPFLDFFSAVLEHYQIHALHIHPNSIFLLATFTYLCKGFLGVMPFLALLCTFYTMRRKEGSITGRASFRMVDRMSEQFIDMALLKKVEKLKAHWIYMKVGQFSPLFAPPIGIVVKSSGLGHSNMEDTQI
ncbi:hypothetical protein D1007_16122 [Hordeum vulgare]|nr:hypothetical protein D1007_16122 [Hordeum vulgare]